MLLKFENWIYIGIFITFCLSIFYIYKRICKNIGTANKKLIRIMLFVLFLIITGVLYATWNFSIIHTEDYKKELLIGIHQSIIDAVILTLIIGTVFKIYSQEKNNQKEVELYEKNLRISKKLAGDSVMGMRALWLVGLLELKPEDGQLKKHTFDGISVSNLNIKKYDFNGSKFNNTNLYDVTFVECNLGGVSFNNSTLRKISFKNSNLERTFFKSARLNGADFSNLKLKKATFDKAILKSSNFCGSDLSGASFKEADLSHAMFDVDIDEDLLLEAKNLTHIKFKANNPEEGIRKYNLLIEKHKEKFDGEPRAKHM